MDIIRYCGVGIPSCCGKSSLFGNAGFIESDDSFLILCDTKAENFKGYKPTAVSFIIQLLEAGFSFPYEKRVVVLGDLNRVNLDYRVIDTRDKRSVSELNSRIRGKKVEEDWIGCYNDMPWIPIVHDMNNGFNWLDKVKALKPLHALSRQSCRGNGWYRRYTDA